MFGRPVPFRHDSGYPPCSESHFIGKPDCQVALDRCKAGETVAGFVILGRKFFALPSVHFTVFEQYAAFSTDACPAT